MIENYLSKTKKGCASPLRDPSPSRICTPFLCTKTACILHLYAKIHSISVVQHRHHSRAFPHLRFSAFASRASHFQRVGGSVAECKFLRFRVSSLSRLPCNLFRQRLPRMWSSSGASYSAQKSIFTKEMFCQKKICKEGILWGSETTLKIWSHFFEMKK